MFKKVLVIISMMIFTVLLTGCNSNDSKLLIFDDDSLIAETGDTYTYSVRNESKESIANQFDLSFRGFTGRETIFTLTASEKTEVTVDILSSISSGQFKVVIVTPENKVFPLASGSDEDTSSIALEVGTYKVKLVGKTAFGTLSMTFTDIDKVTITKTE